MDQATADDVAYWQKKISKYRSEDWSDKPSLFAEEVSKILPKSGKLLDLGCGNGQDGVYFAKQGFEVVETDIADYRGEAAAKLKWQAVDLGKTLPFGPESFDVVYAHQSIHYFTNQRTKDLIKEIHAILKPGGYLALLVNSTDDSEFGEGEEIEPGFFQVGNIKKRFFSVEYTKMLTADLYSPLILDSKGSTYKDRAKNIHNLIRFVGVKK